MVDLSAAVRVCRAGSGGIAHSTGVEAMLQVWFALGWNRTGGDLGGSRRFGQWECRAGFLAPFQFVWPGSLGVGLGMTANP